MNKPLFKEHYKKLTGPCELNPKCESLQEILDHAIRLREASIPAWWWYGQKMQAYIEHMTVEDTE